MSRDPGDLLSLDHVFKPGSAEAAPARGVAITSLCGNGVACQADAAGKEGLGAPSSFSACAQQGVLDVPLVVVVGPGPVLWERYAGEVKPRGALPKPTWEGRRSGRGEVGLLGIVVRVLLPSEWLAPGTRPPVGGPVARSLWVLLW